VTYCIDTSSLIAAWEERYPPEHFPRLWGLLGEAIRTRRVFVHEAVVDETSKKSKELHAWLREFDAHIVPFTVEIQTEARSILRRFERLVMERKSATAADPFVIATAIVHGHTVITEEGRGSANRPRIPDVCRACGIDCITLLGAIRAEGWVIG
jgi:predicted nucleic acid-binding protein